MTTVIRVLDIAVVPVGWIIAAVGWQPELPRVDAVSQERVVERHNMHFWPLCGRRVNDAIVRGMDLQGVRPSGQVGGRRITSSIRGIVDVADKDVTATGKPRDDQIKHLVQPFLVVVDPALSLLPRGAVHGAFARRRGAIPVDQIVAASGQDDDTQRIVRLERQVGRQRGQVILRVGAGHRRVHRGQVGQHGRQAEALHLGELIVRAADQAIEKPV